MRNVFTLLLLTAGLAAGTPAWALAAQTAATVDSTVRTTAEVPPSFRGGQPGFVRFLSRQLQYPEAARDNKIQGAVKVSFVVDEKGFCSGFKVVQSLGYGCDEEALRVLGLMPTWIPGKHKGKPVAVLMTVPVYFQQNTSLNVEESRTKNKYR